MKLSQKLLGLAGLAMADYACCPYDDYGMPDALCAAALREKTPFEGSDRWMDNECKAWESNVDATYEGNNRAGGCAPNNWGSCGFQRHFPWRNLDTAKNEDDALSVDAFTKLEIDTDAITAAFDSADGEALAANYNLGGLPFLGGMCKLFVPVPSASVVQVQIAGVHKQGNSIAQYPARATFGGTTLDGTAYCFSVVNVHESRDNTNNINNGNVAGEGVQTNPSGREDLFNNKNSLERQAGIAFGIGFGSDLSAQVRGTDYNGEAKVGSNFDVVAHFADTWCETNGDGWQVTDMQLAGDENAGVNDYPINQASGFSHAHTDIMDKRHDTLGYGTLYTASTTTNYLKRAEVIYADVTYAAQDLVRWPNSGAWAGFYSFVVCAKSGATTTLDKNVWGTSDRDSAMSVSASDYRVGDEVADCATEFANFRFNLRQVGAKIELCGPGQLPDGGSKRCTWNWNYNESATFGTSNQSDPEGFFDRSEQMAIDSWTRKRRGALGRTSGSNNVVAVLDTARFVFSFKDQDNAVIANDKATLTADVHADLITISEATNTWTADLACTNAGSATQRDSFPHCFTGDEVHFNLAYQPSANDDVRKAVSPWFSSVATSHV